MTIASSDETGEAWASPVAYVYDDSYNLYWVSVPKSKHQRNINYNPKVSLAIFDSHQLWGEGVGVQIEATVEQVSFMELPKVTKLYFRREYPYGNASGAFGDGLKELLKGKVYHFYKATPTKVWIPDPKSDIDSRLAIDLT